MALASRTGGWKSRSGREVTLSRLRCSSARSFSPVHVSDTVTITALDVPSLVYQLPACVASRVLPDILPSLYVPKREVERMIRGLPSFLSAAISTHQIRACSG